MAEYLEIEGVLPQSIFCKMGYDASLNLAAASLTGPPPAAPPAAWRQVIAFAQALTVVIDAEAELDHVVDAARKLRGLVQVEARGPQGGDEEQPDQILHRLIGLVRRPAVLGGSEPARRACHAGGRSR